MKAVLLARLCAQESFDTMRFLTKMKTATDKFVNFPLQREIYRFTYGGRQSFSPGTYEKLDIYDRVLDFVFFDFPVSDFETFRQIGRLLLERYREALLGMPIIGNPLRFYNDFVFRPLYSKQRLKQQGLFFESELFRADKFLSLFQRMFGSRCQLITSDESGANEKAILNMLGFRHAGSSVSVPTPVSHAAKDVNRFYGLPKFRELVEFNDWRGIVSNFETGLTRIAQPENFQKLSSQCERYWKYAMKRHPELEQIADFDPAPYMEAPAYAGFEAKKLASLLPGNFGKHFGCLRQGFPGFYQPVFNEFEKLEMPKTGPRCTVVTFTYNHEKYIADCIEGVAAQKGCDIEHLIFDDASKDATPEIISQFAAKYQHVKPVLFKRKPLTTIEPAFQSCRNEYVALCDGDDYFTDPEKLRKQIEVLSKNPALSICSHYAKIIYEDGRPSQTFPDPKTIGAKRVFSLADILQGNFIQTCSVMYRWRFRDGLPSWFNPALRPADWYWHVLHAEKGAIGFIPEEMAVYRRHAAAVYATADTNDPKKHFLKHGLRELEVFDELDRHFKGKYHKDFENLAVGVFARLYTHAIESDDDAPYQTAAKMFPGFAKNFLEQLAEVSKRGNR